MPGLHPHVGFTPQRTHSMGGQPAAQIFGKQLDIPVVAAETAGTTRDTVERFVRQFEGSRRRPAATGPTAMRSACHIATQWNQEAVSTSP
jgi:hypothetical protein